MHVEQTIVLSCFDDGTWDGLLTLHGPDGATFRVTGKTSPQEALEALQRLVPQTR